MSLGDITNKFLIAPNTLKKLAGEEDELLMLEQMGDEYFSEIGEDATSVEIITLDQYHCELAFDYLIAKEEFSSMPLEDLADHIEDVLPKFSHIRPHILVGEGEITVIVDCAKIDTQIVEYVSKLLRTIPSLATGFCWEYLKKE